MRQLRYMADRYEENSPNDLAAYFNAGRSIIALKVSEGVSHVDREHANRARWAHAEGGTVMHYHFARPDAGNLAFSEADFFIRLVRPTWQPGDFLMLDIERATRELTADDAKWCQEFAARCHATFGATPVIYANESTLNTTLRNLRIKGERYLGAKYGDGWLHLNGRKRVWGWQFTDGVKGKQPHTAPGLGATDQSLLPLSVAVPLWLRTRRRRWAVSRKARK